MQNNGHQTCLSLVVVVVVVVRMVVILLLVCMVIVLRQWSDVPCQLRVKYSCSHRGETFVAGRKKVGSKNRSPIPSDACNYVITCG